MTNEQFEKLFSVVSDIQGEVVIIGKKVDNLEQKVNSLEKKVDKLEKGQEEINHKLDRLEDNIDLLAQKQWNNEKDIYRIKRTMGFE